VVGRKQNIQWAEFVLERPDGYCEGQVAIAANRFPKKLRAGFIFSPIGTASAVGCYYLATIVGHSTSPNAGSIFTPEFSFKDSNSILSFFEITNPTSSKTNKSHSRSK
jgi:hypothetical protein